MTRGFRGVDLEPVLQRLIDHVLDHRADFRGHQLVLGLRGEFRVRHFDREHRGETFAAIVAGERHLFLARGAQRLGVLRYLAGERAAEAGQVSAAVALRDVVGEAQHALMIAVVPPKCCFHRDAFALGLDHDRIGDQRRLVAVEKFHEGLDAALVFHLLAFLHRVAHVGQHDGDAGIEEGELAQTVLERGEVELDHGEGLGRGQEGDFGAALAFRVAGLLQRRHRDAVVEFHEVLFAVAPDGELEPARQRVHHRDADAVQAAGDLVGILVEFSAGMQLGHDDLGRRNAFAFMDVGRDAAAVVDHGHRAVGVERDRHLIGEARERLVDGVVDHLVDHVVQAGAVVGIADVHARPLAHGIESFQDLDRFCAVVGFDIAGQFSHRSEPQNGRRNESDWLFCVT